jgi:hypothetical protein
VEGLRDLKDCPLASYLREKSSSTEKSADK